MLYHGYAKRIKQAVCINLNEFPHIINSWELPFDLLKPEAHLLLSYNEGLQPVFIKQFSDMNNIPVKQR